MSTKARELAELSRTIIDTSDATAITINANEEVTLADDLFLADDKQLVMGDNSEFTLKHHNSGYGQVQNTGTLFIDAEAIDLRTDNSSISSALSLSATNAAVFSGAVTAASLTVTGALIANDVLTVIDGSTSAPSISNAGDSNTGIYFPADDQLGLLVGGSRKLHVTSSGVAIQNGSLTGVAATFSGSVTASGDLLTASGLKVASHPVVGFSAITGGYAANLGSTGSSTLNETHIYAGGNRRVVIDGSGHFLVGATSTALNVSSSVSGHNLFEHGYAVHSRDGQTVMSLNRLSNDGTVVDFRKDGSTVGSLQTRAGVVTTLVLNPASGNGAGLSGGTKAVVPADEAGIIDNDISLGVSTHRFKDLYLSSSVFTPVVQGLGDEAGLTFGGALVAPRKNNAAANGTVDLGASSARFKDFYLGNDIAHLDAAGNARLLYDKSANLLGNAGTNVEAASMTVGPANTNSTTTVKGANNIDGFLGTFGTGVSFQVARHPLTGTFSNTNTAAAAINLNSANGDSKITFFTTTTNNTVPTERMQINRFGDPIFTGGSSTTLEVRAPTDNAFISLYGGYNDSGAEEAGMIMFQNTTAKWQVANTTANKFRIYNYAASQQALTIDSTSQVGVGTQSAMYATFDVNGSIRYNNSYLDLAANTNTVGSNNLSAGQIEFQVSYAGTYAAGKTFEFTYEATTWKSFQGEISLAGTHGISVFRFGGYWNLSGGGTVFTVHNAGSDSCALSFPSGQHVRVTLTIASTYVHPVLFVRYVQGGGDGAPRMDRAKVAQG